MALLWCQDLKTSLPKSVCYVGEIHIVEDLSPQVHYAAYD